MPDLSFDGAKRILCSGARTWTDPVPVREALLKHGPGIVVHGAARGLDTLAGSVARRWRWRVEAHPAKWQELGAAAGPIRNQAMVDLGATVALCFPDPESVGTYDLAARAERAGIPVVWVPAWGVAPEQIRACMAHARLRLEGQRLRGVTHG